MLKNKKFEIDQEMHKRDFGYFVLYRRPDHKSPRWNCRIKIDGSTRLVRSSCRTIDKESAYRFADGLYKSLAIKQQITGDIQSKVFPKVVTEFLKNAGSMNISENAVQEYKERLTNYPAKYWKNTPIDEIQRSDVEEFVRWRRLNGIKKTASNTTIKRELGQLSRVFKFAYGRGYIQKLVEFPRLNGKNKPRPHFTRSEYRQLTRNLTQWVKDAKEISSRVFRDRFYLQHAVLILSNSGCRVGELRELKWADIGNVSWENNEEGICLWVSGKTGKRQVIPQQVTKEYLNRIFELRTKELGQKPDKGEYVITHPDGTKIHSFKKGFSTFLKSCDLLEDQEGNRHTLYSLRHTYGVFRISEEVNQYLLATNMGTSVQMLHKHYLKLTPETHAAEITKTRNPLKK